MREFVFTDELESLQACSNRVRGGLPTGAASPRRLVEPDGIDYRWWSQTESNRRPPACKAGALPTELWPRIAAPAKREWWAWEDLNFRPHAYQARALTN